MQGAIPLAAGYLQADLQPTLLVHKSAGLRGRVRMRELLALPEQV